MDALSLAPQSFGAMAAMTFGTTPDPDGLMDLTPVEAADLTRKAWAGSGPRRERRAA